MKNKNREMKLPNWLMDFFFIEYNTYLHDDAGANYFWKCNFDVANFEVCSPSILQLLQVVVVDYSFDVFFHTMFV